MNGYLGTIGSSFSSMWHSREGINLKSIRLSRLCYMLAYTFELILFSVRGHFMPVGVEVHGVSGVSESTVKNHTSELYKKLGINSRVELFKIFGVDENADE